MPGESSGSAASGLCAGLDGEGDADEQTGTGAESAGGASVREILLRPVASLDLSVRASNCLREENIETVGDLARKTKDELLLFKNFGKTSLKEIEKKLEDLGIPLGMDVDAALKG